MKMKWDKRCAVLALSVGLSFCSPLVEAQPTTGAAKPQNLRLVFPAHGKEGEAIQVRYTLTDKTLVVNFEVSTRDSHPAKVGDAEIYNGNVVELFVCTSAKPAQIARPYYEFEVSPYNQELQVLIDKDGKFNEKWKTAGFKHSATFQKERPGWDATMEIPLKELGWNGDPTTLVGNAFAIVGAKGVRRFYSAYLPPQEKPNFHQPKFFRPFPVNGTAPAKTIFHAKNRTHRIPHGSGESNSTRSHHLARECNRLSRTCDLNPFRKNHA